MSNNKLTPVQCQDLTQLIVELVTSNPKELEWLIDSYLYSLDDKEVDELQVYLREQLGDDCMQEFIPGFHD